MMHISKIYKHTSISYKPRYIKSLNVRYFSSFSNPLFYTRKTIFCDFINRLKIISKRNAGSGKSYGHINKLLPVLHQNKNTPTIMTTKSNNISDKIEEKKQIIYTPPDSRELDTPKGFFTSITNSFNKIVKSSVTGKIISEEENTLKNANLYGIIKYEDTHEYKESGGAKVTKIGHEIMAHLEKQEDILLKNFIKNETYNDMLSFKIVTLNIENSSTIIPKPSQTHWVVIHDTMNDCYRAIGILTSKKMGNTLLWDSQPIGGELKKQYFGVLNTTYLLKEKDFIINDFATNYLLQDEKAKNMIISRLDEIDEKPCKIYTQKGYTMDLLKQATIKVKEKFSQTINDNIIGENESQVD
jgi:hypothetical protein